MENRYSRSDDRMESNRLDERIMPGSTRSYLRNNYRWNGSDRHANGRFDYDNDYSRRSRDFDDDRSFADRVEDAWDSTKETVKSFFGKGPKGYKRTDERICEDVCETLSRDHKVDASDM